MKRTEQKGIALIVVLLVLSLLAVVAMGLATMGSDNLLVVRSQGWGAVNAAAAEAGAWRAASEIADGLPAGASPRMGYFNTVPIPSGDATYTVDIYEGGDTPPGFTSALPANHFFIDARGETPAGQFRGAPRRVTMVVRQSSTVFPGAIFADNKIKLEDALTDSWDSSKGPYAVSKVLGAGQAKIGTNRTTNNSVELKGSSVLDPDAGSLATANVLVPPGASPGAVKGVSPNNYAAVQYMASPRKLPPVDMEGQDPTLASDLKAYTGAGIPPFDAGGYLIPGVYKDVEVDGWDLKLRGGSKYYFQSLKVKKTTGSLTLEPAAPAATVVKVLEGVKLEEDTVVNDTGIPSRLTLESASTDTGLTGLQVAGKNLGVDAYFTFYAPKAKVKIEGEVYGSVTGYEVQLKSGAAVHYDLALADTASAGAGAVELVSIQRF